LSERTRAGKSAGAFRTISEVSQHLSVAQHVLRFWESKFSQVSPMKRGGGRRYYRPEDVHLLERIRDLLYVEGFTIKGVQRLIRERGVKALLAEEMGSPSPDGEVKRVSASSAEERQEIVTVVTELLEIRKLLDPAPMA